MSTSRIERYAFFNRESVALIDRHNAGEGAACVIKDLLNDRQIETEPARP